MAAPDDDRQIMETRMKDLLTFKAQTIVVTTTHYLWLCNRVLELEKLQAKKGRKNE